MNVSAPFIKRPVATSLMAAAVFLVGLLGFSHLPVSPLPQVDFPTIQVTTQLPGANADTIAKVVTASLERQLGQIPSLASMSSQSSFGLSQITLQFELDRDIDAAAQDVQSAINSAGSTLPKNLPYPPVYAKINPADAPVVTLALRSKYATIREISDLADTLIAPRLAELHGVGRVAVEGGVKPAVRIQADLARLAANQIGMEDVRAAIAAANVAGAKGSLNGERQSYTLDANDQLSASNQFENVVVAYRNGAPIMLGDVANVVDGLEDSRVGGWYRGDPVVILDVQRQPDANIVDTVELVKKELKSLRRVLPRGMTIEIVNDRTETIRAAIVDVEFTLVVATLLVVLVVLLFLRSWRATIIAGISLPLSIVASFAVMWLAGFSLDNLSLMALTIGTGFVVDDAIVMIENIVRNIELGKSPLRAALDGAREIGFTVVSLTASLIAVFIPLLFMAGLVGRMFREFALTLSVQVVISAIVSLTLTPMLCATMLKADSGAAPHAAGAIEGGFAHWLDQLYERTLVAALRNQTLIILLTGGTLALTTALFIAAPKGFLPLQDTSLLNVVIEASPETSFEAMTRLQAEVSKVLEKDKDVTGTISVLGVGLLNATTNVGHLFVTLRGRDIRRDAVDQIALRLKKAAEKVSGVSVFVDPVQDIKIATKNSRLQYQYTLTSPNVAELNEWSDKLLLRLRTDPSFAHVASEIQGAGLVSMLRIDRKQMGRLGITAQNVVDTLNDAFGQRQVSTIYSQSNQYRVILEAMPQYQRDPRALQKLYVASPGGGVQTPLASFIHMEHAAAPLSIAHQDQFPARTISFDLASGASLGDAVEAITRAEEEIGFPKSIVGLFSGEAAEFRRSLANEPWLIVAAVVAIYVVLGVLYESYAHPFTVLTTLPSAGVGALLALRLTGLDLSIVALIGIVLLMGIVKKNAIMMIDFALEAQRIDLLTSFDSIVLACRLRFRPIMMTTLAALLGALPLALAQGPGSELRIPLGVSIIGGLLLSQVLTLYTTPVIYLAIDRSRFRFRGLPVEEQERASRPLPQNDGPFPELRPEAAE